MKYLLLDLAGGIGNQLFQVCFARELSDKKDYRIVVNRRRFYQHIDNHGEFLFDSIRFEGDYIQICNSYAAFIATSLGWRLSSLIERRNQTNDNKNTFLHRAKAGFLWSQRTDQLIEGVDDIVIHNPLFTLVDGYYQWPELMLKSVDWMRKCIRFTYANSEQLNKYQQMIKESNAVALHIRRGDYVNHPYLSVCNYEYYKKAIDYVEKNVCAPVFFIFSDDVEWVKANYRFDGIYIKKSKVSSNDLMLMSMCKHFIISNSTFSWWAQILSSNTDKIVIAPDVWFSDGKKCELYMDYFVLIETEAN